MPPQAQIYPQTMCQLVFKRNFQGAKLAPNPKKFFSHLSKYFDIKFLSAKQHVFNSKIKSL